MRATSSRLQAVPLGPDTGLVGVVAFHGQFEGSGEADDEGDVFGTGTAPVLLVAAEQEGPAGRSAADEKGAYSFRCMKLVAGEGEEIDVLEGPLADRSGACRRSGWRHSGRRSKGRSPW